MLLFSSLGTKLQDILVITHISILDETENSLKTEQVVKSSKCYCSKCLV